jgi:hypothetical protein
MERLGLVKRNLTSRWASTPLILPKAGPEKFRFTLDLRYPNSQDQTGLLANAEHGGRVGVTIRFKVLCYLGPHARILAATSTRGLSRVGVTWHHERDGTHAVHHGGPDARHTSLSQDLAGRQHDTRDRRGEVAGRAGVLLQEVRTAWYLPPRGQV